MPFLGCTPVILGEFNILCPFLDGFIINTAKYIFIGWSDNPPGGKSHLLEPVCTPAGHTGNGEDRGKEFLGYINALVNKTRIEIDVGTDNLGIFAFKAGKGLG